MQKFILLFLLAVPWCIQTEAQQAKKYGQLSGVLESSSALYFNDELPAEIDSSNKLATNNYLKLNYRYKSFSAGVQTELYKPALVGYSRRYNGVKLVQAYVKYTGNKTSITIGNFYEQIGNGLAFRSYEDNSLGFNNSMLGVSIQSSPLDALQLNAFAGSPRVFMQYSSTIVGGVDANLSMAKLLKTKGEYDFTLGVGYTYQKNETDPRFDYPDSVQAISLRTSFYKGGFNMSAESVFRSNALVYTPLDDFSVKPGRATLVNVGYDKNGLGINLSGRRLEYMQTRIENTITSDPVFLNYLPALTKQHKFALANLFPYNVQSYNELALQLDVFYEFKNSVFGGKYPEKLAVNYSTVSGLKKFSEGNYAIITPSNKKLFTDFSFELDKKWTKKFKTASQFLYQKIDRIKADGIGTGQMYVYAGMLEATYRITLKKSVRMEFQHAWTDGVDGDWLYALAEFGIAPKWLFYADVLHNYTGIENQFYYNIGSSFSKGNYRFALAYNKNRAGYQCSGGVCRYVPAFEGLVLSINASF